MGFQKWFSTVAEELGKGRLGGVPDVVLLLGVIAAVLLIVFLVVLYLRECEKKSLKREEEKPCEKKQQQAGKVGKKRNSDMVSRDKTVVYSRMSVAGMPILELICCFNDGERVNCFVEAEEVLRMPEQVVKIGREEGQHIVVEDESVSPRHLELGVDRSGYWIEDVSYSGTTKVNGRCCAVRERVRLHSGDRILLGDVELEVVLGGAPE